MILHSLYNTAIAAFSTVAQKVTRDSTLAIRIPNILGDSMLRDCTSAI